MKYSKGFKYQLTENYSRMVRVFPGKSIKTEFIDLRRSGLLIIRDGFTWDGASGPTIDTENTMESSLVHDALYRLMREGLLPFSCRVDADREFIVMCIRDGMSLIRATLWYLGVRLFAAGAARP